MTHSPKSRIIPTPLVAEPSANMKIGAATISLLARTIVHVASTRVPLPPTGARAPSTLSASIRTDEAARILKSN